jgi:mono/diheme cytochrome c family protein
MDDQPRYDPLESSTFFADGTSARHLVPGTVPRTKAGNRSNEFDEQFVRGRVDGEWTADLPEQVLENTSLHNVLVRGQERYGIFCAPCHDLVGTGNGLVPQRGFPFPPTFHSPRLREIPLGYFFTVTTDGIGRMPDYGRQIPIEDRWAIAAYIRALQLSQHVPADDLPAQDRQRLEGGNP